jgi:hypothetical protein
MNRVSIAVFQKEHMQKVWGDAKFMKFDTVDHIFDDIDLYDIATKAKM